jgi:hypothetical protein
VTLTYIVTDGEYDGPDPARHSMLAFASVALVDGEIGPCFEAVLEPLPNAVADPGVMAWFKSEPGAYAAATLDPRSPGQVMADFVSFVRSLPGTPVFAAHPLAVDGKWFDHYLRRFTGEWLVAGPRDRSPLFRHPSLCIASFLAGRLGWEISRCRYANYPSDWLGNYPHSHRAIDDTLGYASLLKMLLALPAPKVA